MAQTNECQKDGIRRWKELSEARWEWCASDEEVEGKKQVGSQPAPPF